MAKLVSKTYGDALFQLAVETDRTDSFLEEVKEVLKVLKDNPDLMRLMSHPKIVKEEKIQLLESVFKGRITDELLGLMCTLTVKGHYEDVVEVLQYFVDQVKEFKNIGTAYVTSAKELSDKQKEDVKQKLLSTTKYVEFEMNYDVDAELIGGMVIRIKDRVVDSSIRTKLYELSKELNKIQLKAGEVTS